MKFVQLWRFVQNSMYSNLLSTPQQHKIHKANFKKAKGLEAKSNLQTKTKTLLFVYLATKEFNCYMKS